MRTIAILSQKGGSGRTTFTLQLAVAALYDGQSVAIVDLDPQASAAGWKDSRPGDDPVVVPIPHTRLPQALKTAADAGAALTLIDTAPNSEAPAMAAARAADLCLIPCRPGILDLRAIGATAELVKLAGKPAFVILNAVPPRASALTVDATAAIATHGLRLAPVVIHQRAAFVHALTVGKTAQEYEPYGAASQEIGNLKTWIAANLAA
jgi:chromosome partitioning protein